MVRAEVERVAYPTDLETLAQKPATHLELNDIGRVTIACHRPLYFDPYRKNRGTGAFILIDSLSNVTVAAGMIVEANAAPADTAGATPTAEEPARRSLAGQPRGAPAAPGPAGLRGLAHRAAGGEQRPRSPWPWNAGCSTSAASPWSWIRRDGLGPPASAGSVPLHTGELARRFADAGLIGIFSCPSPTPADRAAVQAAVGAERFIDIDVDLDLNQGDPERAANSILDVLVARGALPSLELS